MLATTEGQNTMFKAVDYFPAYKPAWDAAPELYTEGDDYFGGQAPNSIATKIAADVPVVYNTIMDVTAEGYLYSSSTQVLRQVRHRSRSARDLETISKQHVQS